MRRRRWFRGPAVRSSRLAAAGVVGAAAAAAWLVGVKYYSFEEEETLLRFSLRRLHFWEEAWASKKMTLLWHYFDPALLSVTKFFTVSRGSTVGAFVAHILTTVGVILPTLIVLINGAVFKNRENTMFQLCAIHFVWNAHAVGHASMAIPFLARIIFVAKESYWEALYDALVFWTFVCAPLEMSTGIVKGFASKRRVRFSWRHRAALGVLVCHVTFFYGVGTYYVRPTSFDLTCWCTFCFYGYAGSTYLPANPQGDGPEISGTREWPWLKTFLKPYLWDPIFSYLQIAVLVDDLDELRACPSERVETLIPLRSLSSSSSSCGSSSSNAVEPPTTSVNATRSSSSSSALTAATTPTVAGRDDDNLTKIPSTSEKNHTVLLEAASVVRDVGDAIAEAERLALGACAILDRVAVDGRGLPLSRAHPLRRARDKLAEAAGDLSRYGEKGKKEKLVDDAAPRDDSKGVTKTNHPGSEDSFPETTHHRGDDPSTSSSSASPASSSSSSSRVHDATTTPPVATKRVLEDGEAAIFGFHPHGIIPYDAAFATIHRDFVARVLLLFGQRPLSCTIRYVS